ncbi:MAG: T9SS C-terminal target domain-containing protein [Calditrichaeota bacterium]|nr:MAG: T9SS C-terminal target domain-containing protein [Calditrichota bacterium]
MRKKMWIHSCILLLITLVGFNQSWAQTLVINEFLASNDSVNLDIDGEASDWLELFNFGEATVNLAGLSLTDDPAIPDKWLFPDQVIEPQNHLLIWASGKDLKQVELHTNFKLNAGGEFIGLYAADGSAIDSLTFTDQSTDVAFGRFLDGSKNWQFLPTPTPGETNQTGGTVENYKIKFSWPSNVYANRLQLEISTIPEGGNIYFSTDFSRPNQFSKLYQNPLDLNSITIVRAQVFDGSNARSELETRTYIINDDPQLPVVSLVTEHENLWDPFTGIYTNYEKEGDAWERPARIRLIENGESKFSAPVGIRIHGNSSRSTDKKNFRVYFRSEYGDTDLDYKLFPQKEINTFKRLILYAPSGDQPTGDSKWNMLHDVLSHAVFNEMDGLFSSWKPVSLYLNDEYWGIYWLREHVDNFYAESNLGYEEVDMMRSSRRWQADVREGDRAFWDETLDYFRNHSLKNESNYARAKNEYLDIEDFTDYQIINIFSGNWDWPDNNLDFVHDRLGSDGRWRHIMWDTGAAWRWQYDHPTLEWATRDTVRTDIKYNDKADVLWSTLILRRLLENWDYKYYFINRFADLLNTNLQSDKIRDLKEELAASIRPEISREAKKWDGGSLGTWENNQTVINNFISRRPAIQRDHIKSVFDLSHEITVTIAESEGDGHLILNTISPQEFPWSGRYFANVPVTIEAVPAPGYLFAGWSEISDSEDSIIVIKKSSSFSVSAKFTQQPQVITALQVDSVTTNSAQIGWTTRFPAGAELTLSADSSTQMVLHDSSMVITHTLNPSGLVDGTEYTFTLKILDTGFGSATAEGSFKTKRLIIPPEITNIQVDSLMANAARISWQTDQLTHGWITFGIDSSMEMKQFSEPETTNHSAWLTELNPKSTYFYQVGAKNIATDDSSVSSILNFTTLTPSAVAGNDNAGIPRKFWVSQNYPNPFNIATKIRIGVPESGHLQGLIYNISGRLVSKIVDRHVQAGLSEISWNGLDESAQIVASGLYFVRVRFVGKSGKEENMTRRLLLLK